MRREQALLAKQLNSTEAQIQEEKELYEELRVEKDTIESQDISGPIKINEAWHVFMALTQQIGDYFAHDQIVADLVYARSGSPVTFASLERPTDVNKSDAWKFLEPVHGCPTPRELLMKIENRMYLIE